MSEIISYRQIYDEMTKLLNPKADIMQSYSALKALRDKVGIAADLTSRKFPDWNNLDKPIMALDFDGCICSQEHGWEGIDVIRGTPIENAFRFIQDALEHFHVVIFSTRCNDPKGIIAMRSWFLQHGLDAVTISKLLFEPGKPSYFVCIDDRALHFAGDWASITPPKYLKETFKPWDWTEGGWEHAQKMSKTVNPSKPEPKEQT